MSNKAKENIDEARTCNSNHISCKWGNLYKTIISKINTPDICQINWSFHIQSKELKDLHSLQYFLATHKIISHLHEKTDFLSTLLKEPQGFSEYVKFLINYCGPKLQNCYLNMEEKNLSLLSFKQRIKEKLNTWKLWLLLLRVLFAVFCCIKCLC